MKLRASFLLGLGSMVAVLGAPQAPPSSTSACVSCHGNPDFVGEEEAQIVQLFQDDIHASVGLTCQDCHGGNSDPQLSEDPEKSMNRSLRQNPFVGAPAATEIPAFCGRCHSDAERMKRYRPGLRVDQEQEYWTSRHGRALRRGDPRVATCVSCHGAHGVRRVDDPKSPVYPRQVAETCRRCHADAALMSNYRDESGRPLGTDQYVLWRRSVHAQSLLDREDLSAPTCNDCHGNHGAAPPGLDSIVFVCGQCHGREASLFRASPKEAAWRQHDEFLAEAGSESCLACHDAGSPQAKMTHLKSFGECTVCHGNHGVIRPTVAMFAPLPETPCSFCHEGSGSVSGEYAEPEGFMERYVSTRDALLQTAAELSLEGDERFDWMVDQARSLSVHRLPGDDGGSDGVLRPEFQRLFEKFRIGKTAFLIEAPGQSIRLEVVRCTNCHANAPNESASSGLLTGINFLNRMKELTALTARAERVLLAARRGGVETRPGFLMIDKAVDTQISLEVLIHGFREEGAFEEKHAEGMRHVDAALKAGGEAMRELSQRRVGLGASLGFVLLFLIALGLKIHRLQN